MSEVLSIALTIDSSLSETWLSTRAKNVICNLLEKENPKIRDFLGIDESAWLRQKLCGRKTYNEIADFLCHMGYAMPKLERYVWCSKCSRQISHEHSIKVTFDYGKKIMQVI